MGRILERGISADTVVARGVVGAAIPIGPPEWRTAKLITKTTSTEVVPQNVYQILVMVWGAGAPGEGAVGKGGAGGGFAMGIVDVTPGQVLPTITIGVNAGQSSSFGALISATGAIGWSSPGQGFVAPTVRSAFTAVGGLGGGSANGGGGASGSPYGDGGNGANSPGGGGGWAGADGSAQFGGIPVMSVLGASFSYLSLAHAGPLPLSYTPSLSTLMPAGCGGFGSSVDSLVSKHGGLGAGAGAISTAQGGTGGFLGGGGAAGQTGGLHGKGAVILFWTEGY